MTAAGTKPRVRVVLFEGAGSAPLEDDARLDLLKGLLDAGHAVTRPAAGAAVAPADDAPHLVVGRFAPDARARLAAADDLDLFDLDDAAGVEAVLPAVEAANARAGATSPGEWKPWFPVIDYDRCTNCMQCLTFCLFDVYGVDGDQKIEVRTESNCKTDCPACSRVCPEAAILFPKYKKGPINGAPVTEEDLKSEAMKADISALLGGDLYRTLRDRSAAARQRFSTERDESKALLERKRCLKELGKTLDIPDEVLMTLPSVEDIEAKAARAKEKLEERRRRSRTVNDGPPKPPPSADDWGI
ncbi:MAG: ferredoxin family protein [Planctomycetota bacterium JB042]